MDQPTKNSCFIAIGLLSSCANQYYQSQIDACLETWVPEAEKNGIQTYFFAGPTKYSGTKTTERIIYFNSAGDDYVSASKKQWLGLKYLANGVKADFYLIGGTDNYIWPQRLIKKLSIYDPKDKLYIGGHGEERLSALFWRGLGVTSHKIIHTVGLVKSHRRLRRIVLDYMLC